MQIRMIQRLFVAIGVVAAMTTASCGGIPQQLSFIPNCAPEPQSGPNVVAKVRYKVKVKNGTNSDGSEIIKTETQLRALNEPMEGTAPPADIRLPVTVELLNDQDTVLLTRSISDPELNNENLHGHSNTATVSSDFKDRNRPRNPDPIDFFSTQGNRFIDTVEYEWKGNFGNTGSWAPKLTKRQVFLVDQGDVIACNAKVVRPTPPPPPCNAQLLTAASSQVSTFGPNFRFPTFVAAGPNGSIYSKTNDGIVKFTGASETATLVALVSGLKAQASDPAGNVYYYYRSRHAIFKISPTGGESVFKQGSFELIASDVDFNDVSGMTADSLGNVYIIDRHSVRAGGTTTSWNDLRKITSNGTVSTLVSKPAAEWPIGDVMTARADGTVYIAEVSTGAIHVVSPTGTLSTVPIAASANVGQIGGLAVDCAGNVYASETFGHRILTITPAGAVSTLAGTGSAGNKEGKATEATFKEPMGLALDAANNALYVADSGNGRIRKISKAVQDTLDVTVTGKRVKLANGTAELSLSVDPLNSGTSATTSVPNFASLWKWRLLDAADGTPITDFAAGGSTPYQFNLALSTAWTTGVKGKFEVVLALPSGTTITRTSNEFVIVDGPEPQTVSVFLATTRGTETLVQREGLPPETRVSFSSVYADGGPPTGAAGRLATKIKAAAGGLLTLPDNAGYDTIDTAWKALGGTVEVTFVPGTVKPDSHGFNIWYPQSGFSPIAVPTDNAQAAAIIDTVRGPTATELASFRTTLSPNEAATGYFRRKYVLSGRTYQSMTSNQVTWATQAATDIDNQFKGGSGGAGGVVAQPAPTITSLSSTSGGGLGTTITITGTNFRAPATVKFGAGAVLGTGLTVNSATSITVTLPTLAAGAHAVVVTNTDNNTTSTPTNYTVTAPTITGIAPNNGAAATAITITGTNFRGGAGAGVTVNGVAATGVTFVSATQITATTPAGQAAGTYNVVVTNSDTTSVTSVGGYTVNGGGGGAPTFTSVVSATWAPAPATAWTVTGTNFVNGAVVSVNGVNQATTFVDANTLTGSFAGGIAPGVYDLVVTNPDTQSVTSVGAVTVTP